MCRSGGLFVASHSGSMIGALVSRGRARGVGFAGLVSVGSECDLSLGEICAATLDDPGIEGYVLFLESLNHGAALRAFAIEAARRGKPVIAYKLGRSAAAAEMAADPYRRAGRRGRHCRRLSEGLRHRPGRHPGGADGMPAAGRRGCRCQPGQPAPRRVGIVTTTGGGAAMVVDQLGIRGIDVEPASPDTLARLAAAGISVHPGRVADLTLAGARYDVMKAALDIMLAAPEFDLVLAVVGSSARMQPELAVKPIIDSAGSAKPLAAMIVPDAPQAIAQLTAAQVPCFRTPEACADVIAAVFARRSPLGLIDVQRRRPAARGRARPLSEAQAYQLLDQLGVPHAPCVTTAIDGEAPAAPAVRLPGGGQGLFGRHPAQDRSRRRGARRRRPRRPAGARWPACAPTWRSARPASKPNEALIQPMTQGLAEVLIGYKVDPQAGPIVMLAAGGIWAEVARDRSIRLAPVERRRRARDDRRGAFAQDRRRACAASRAATSRPWRAPSAPCRSWRSSPAPRCWRPRSTR